MVTLFSRHEDDLCAKQCRKPHRWSALPGATDRSRGIFVSAGPENDKKKKKTQQNKTDAPIVHTTTTTTTTTELVVTSQNREFLHGRIIRVYGIIPEIVFGFFFYKKTRRLDVKQGKEKEKERERERVK